jgi:LemA protein
VQQVFKQEGEKNVYLELAKTRESYAGAKTVDEKVVASQNLNSGLARLLAITENYPVLKASENIKELTASIEGTENRMSVERGRFNESVGRYNGYILVIPNNMIAKIFGFTSMKTFDNEEASTKAPNVKELFNN